MDLCLIVTFYTRRKLLVWNKVVWELLVYEQSFFMWFLIPYWMVQSYVRCVTKPHEKGERTCGAFEDYVSQHASALWAREKSNSGHHSFPDCSPYKREICFASPTSRITSSALAMPLTSTLASSANQKKEETWTDIFGATSYHILTDHSLLLLKRCLGSERCVFKLIYKTAKSIFKIFHLYALFWPGFWSTFTRPPSHLCNGCFFDLRKM